MYLAYSHGAKGTILGENADLLNAKKHFLISKKLLIEENLTNQVIEISMNFANVSILNGEYSQAILEYFELLTKLEDSDLDDINYHRGILNYNLGNAYSVIGDYEKAIEYLSKAENISRKGELVDLYSEVLLKKGSVYNILSKYDVAIESLQKAEKISKKETNLSNLSKIYKELGKLHSKKRKYELSKSYFEKAIDISKKNHYYYNLYYIYKYLANEAIKKRDYGHLHKLLDELNRIPLENSGENIKNELQYYAAYDKYFDEQYEQSLSMIEEILTFKESKANSSFLLKLLNLKILSSEALHKYDQANIALKLKDSLNNVEFEAMNMEKNSKIIELSKTNKILEETKQKYSKAEKAKEELLQYSLITTLAILIAIIMFIFYRIQKNKQNKLKSQIDQRDDFINYTSELVNQDLVRQVMLLSFLIEQIKKEDLNYRAHAIYENIIDITNSLIEHLNQKEYF